MRVRLIRRLFGGAVPPGSTDPAERGAVLIIVAVGMIGVLGMAALAVDLGNAWSNDRRLNTSSDAAALAGAVEILDGGTAEEAVEACEDYLERNHPQATGTCMVDVEEGVVRIEATAPVEYAFAPVLGIDDGEVASVSEATIQPGGAPSMIVGGGMRPFGVCIYALEALIEDESPGWAGDGDLALRIPYGKDSQTQACGGSVPGNWGMVDFNGGSNSNSETKDWVEFGYDGPVTIDLDGSGCPNGTDDDGCYEGDTGAFSNSLGGGLSSLVSSGEIFTIPIFDSNQGGNGANAIWHIVGFLRIRLTGYKANGSAHSRYLDVVIVPGEADGGICCDESPDIDTGVTAPGAIEMTDLG